MIQFETALHLMNFSYCTVSTLHLKNYTTLKIYPAYSNFLLEMFMKTSYFGIRTIYLLRLNVKIFGQNRLFLFIVSYKTFHCKYPTHRRIEPSRTSKMELVAKKVNGSKLLAIFEKSFIFEYASATLVCR